MDPRLIADGLGLMALAGTIFSQVHLAGFEPPRAPIPDPNLGLAGERDAQVPAWGRMPRDDVAGRRSVRSDARPGTYSDRLVGSSISSKWAVPWSSAQIRVIFIECSPRRQAVGAGTVYAPPGLQRRIRGVQ